MGSVEEHTETEVVDQTTGSFRLDTNAVALGKSLRNAFPFDPEFRNLNHGSFGSIPLVIQAKLRSYQDQMEAMPDPFIRYHLPKILDESRAAIAEFLTVPTDTVVFVPNASNGVNTVLRNIVWNEDGKDEIIYFSTVYSGCGKTIDYIVDSGRGLVSARCIDLAYPLEDDEILAKFRSAVEDCRSSGKRARVCLFDVVSSLPGVPFPYAEMTKACKELGVLSLVDGAQGVGLVPINLSAVDPDFFVSNCHKWLHVPRGCAVFYVPFRNQAMISSTLPTSHGYVCKQGGRFNPLPPSTKPAFVNNFEFVGTIDNCPYLCVKDSIHWRKTVLGGEERVIEYIWTLARDGGERAAEILGTFVLNNAAGSLTKCGMVNVALPLVMVSDESTGKVGPGDAAVPAAEAFETTQWMLRVLMDEHKTFLALFVHGGRWFTRLSAQVYLDMQDFEWAGRTLKEVCERVAKREHAVVAGFQALKV